MCQHVHPHIQKWFGSRLCMQIICHRHTTDSFQESLNIETQNKAKQILHYTEIKKIIGCHQPVAEVLLMRTKNWYDHPAINIYSVHSCTNDVEKVSLSQHRKKTLQTVTVLQTSIHCVKSKYASICKLPDMFIFYIFMVLIFAIRL